MEKAKMNPVVHFEIPADDVERAKEFYTKLFGWGIERFEMEGGEPYWIIQTTEVDDKMMPTTPGVINGGMMKRQNPGQPLMNYISVDSIEKFLDDIVAAGGKICMPKMEIAKGMGWIACFQDTEGNMMGLHTPAENKP